MQFKKSDITWAIDRNRERISLYSRLALNFLTDPDKKVRRLEQYCVCCYYRESTMAGQAFTESQCGVCQKDMRWSTTHQEKLCPECSNRLGLCRECGATMELKEPRALKEEVIK